MGREQDFQSSSSEKCQSCFYLGIHSKCFYPGMIPSMEPSSQSRHLTEQQEEYFICLHTDWNTWLGSSNLSTVFIGPKNVELVSSRKMHVRLYCKPQMMLISSLYVETGLLLREKKKEKKKKVRFKRREALSKYFYFPLSLLQLLYVSLNNLLAETEIYAQATQTKYLLL